MRCQINIRGSLKALLALAAHLVCRLAILLIPARRTSLIHYGKFLNQGVIILAILIGLNWIATLLHIKFSLIP